MTEATTILSVENLVTQLGGQRRFLATNRPPIHAVNGINLDLKQGEILGIVGESGCGKTTLGRTILGIQRETEGTIKLQGQVVSGLTPHAARRLRKNIQYVHQDPGAALDPWWPIGRTMHEGLIINGISSKQERDKRINDMFQAVGLDQASVKKYPHEMSGGQLRRVGLARILVLSPQIVILDEPTSGLDLSVQASVLKLIHELRESLQLTYMFISHDLAVVQRMCHRIAIMYLGRIVELAEAKEIFTNPVHPYTRALLASAPRLEPDHKVGDNLLIGEPPAPGNVPSGCSFRNRCPHSEEQCSKNSPTLDTSNNGHSVACIRWHELATLT